MSSENGRYKKRKGIHFIGSEAQNARCWLASLLWNFHWPTTNWIYHEPPSGKLEKTIFSQPLLQLLPQSCFLPNSDESKHCAVRRKISIR